MGEVFRGKGQGASRGPRVHATSPARCPPVPEHFPPRHLPVCLPQSTITHLMTKRIAVFPGQFDPITNGHLDVIRRGTRLFDELIVGVGINPEKRELFAIDERVEMIETLLKPITGTRVERFSGLTVDFVRQVGANVILRGIRDVSDLRYEFQLALANRAVGDVETVFIMTGDQFALTSSSLIRQVVSLGGDVKSLSAGVPPGVVEAPRGQPGAGGPGRRDEPANAKRFKA